MNKEDIPVITDREELYDKCENMEQLFDKYYLPLLYKHYSKTYKLQQENQQLKEQLLVTQTNEETFRLEMEDITRALGLAEDTLFDDVKAYARSLKENIACNWKDSCLENAGKIEILENQQKEFIEYMNKTIEELECDDVDDEEMKGYLIQRIDTFKEILSKFKKIIGSDINVGSIGGK